MDEEKELYFIGVVVTPVVYMTDGKFTQAFIDRVFGKVETDKK